MNQGGYPAQMIPSMMMGSSPYYSQQSGVTGGDMYMPMNMIPSMVYPPPFGTGPLVGSAGNVTVPAVAPPTVLSSSSPPFISSEESPLEPVDLTADAHMQNLSTESSASFSNSTEAVGEPVTFEESSPSAVDDAAEEITGTVAQDHSESSVPTPDPQEKSSSESSCNVSVPSEGGEGESESRDQVYSRDALLSLYRPQSLPQSLLPFYPGLDPDGAKDPLQSGGLGKEATALYLRSSPKSTGGAGVGGSRDFHKADSRDFSGHGSSAGRRDRDFRDTRDRDSRDREKDRNHGTVSMRVNTGFISGDGDGEDGQSSSAPSPQLFFGGSRRGGSSTPHPETPQDAATFGSSSAFGRSSVLSKSAESENSAEAIIKRATLILNKLSVTKFDKLSNEFLEIISTGDNDLLFKVVELLVTKAQMEEHFCFMYADLCRKICNVWEELILDTQSGLCTSDVKTESTVRERDADKDNGEGEGEGGEGKQMTKGKLFRELLLDRCRMEFENDRVKGLEKIRAMVELTEEERLEKELLLKKRYTGHMRFIGEIYIKDLVLANIINEHCLSVLVQETDEEQLVCLCKLFQTVGDKIEKYYNKRARSKKGKERRYDEIIPGHFAAIEKIAQTHPISRVRFMLRDLIEMRANNWTARREEEKVMDLSETRTVVGQGIPAAARSGLGTVSSHPVAVAASDVHVPSTQASIPPPPAPLATIEDEWRTVTKSSKKEKGPTTTTIPPASSSLSNKGSAAVGSGTGQSVKKSQQSSLGSPLKKAAGNTRSGSGSGLSKKSGEDKVVPISTSSSASSKSHAAAIVTAGAEEHSPVFEGDYPNSQQQSSPSPGTAQVLEAPISFAPMDGSVAKKVRSAVDEFYYNGLLEEVDAVLRELLILPTQTADLFKVFSSIFSSALKCTPSNSSCCFCQVLLLHVLEQKKDEVGALCLLLLDLSGREKPLLSTRAIAVGLQNFLEDLDDICMDSPRAVSIQTMKIVTAFLFSKYTSIFCTELSNTLSGLMTCLLYILSTECAWCQDSGRANGARSTTAILLCGDTDRKPLPLLNAGR